MSANSDSRELLTNSRAKLFRLCQRKHHIRYNLCIRGRYDAAALQFGTLLHHAFDTWWSYWKDHPYEQAGHHNDIALELALRSLAEKASDTMNQYEVARARVLVTAYHFRWLPHMADFEVLAVEEEFRSQLINPETGAASKTFVTAGKLDVLVRQKSTGRKLVIDHKTSSDDFGPGSTYVARLRLDSQISMYMDAAKTMHGDDPPASFIYDIIGKPQLRPSKATPEEVRQYTKPKYKQCPECKKKGGFDTAPHTIDGAIGPCEPDPESPEKRRICTDPGGQLYANMRAEDETVEEWEVRLRDAIIAEPERYFARAEIVRLDDEILDHQYDLWQTGRMIRESQLAKRAPKNSDACVAYGRPCEFFSACTGAASLSDPLLFEQLESPHAELDARKEGK